MPIANPMIPQGTLNRLRGSLSIPAFPALNVTAAYLGKAGISLALEGNTTTFIPSMTGAVTSPEPFLMANVTINLLRTQGLADQYKAKMEANAQIGEFTVNSDSSVLGTFTIYNGAIQSIAPLVIDGQDAGYAVTLGGYYYVNNSTWNV